MKMTFQEIRIIATGPCITNQLRDINTTCRRSWFIAPHIWIIYDFKIAVVPFIINFSTELTTTNFRLICLLPIVAYTYICTFVFDPRVGRYENSKMVLFLFINIIYGLFNTTEIPNILFKTLFYPENI
jgi:hypothetical protein